MEFRRKVSALAALIVVSSIAVAQRQSAANHLANFGVTSELVAIPVSVTDRKGHTVLDLRSEDFAITDNGAPQQVLSVSRWDVPVSVCVVFDASGSMKRSVRTAQIAVRVLLNDNGPEDEACLVRFSSRPELLVDFTHDADLITNKLLWDRPRGATALADAVYAGLNQMKHAANSRKALVVITDGGENSSRYSFSELLSVARESDVQVYTVGLRGNVLDKEEQRGRLRLEQVTDATGGKLLIIDSSGALPRVLATVNELIRNQYLLTYRPINSPQDGKWHPVRVRVQPPSKASLYRVNARGGYYASKQ